MKSTKEFGTFFVPGPTECRAEVLEAMAGPMIPHRSAAFEELFARAQTGLKEVFLTKRPVMITASSATGMMESAVRCLRPGRVLCLVNGAFSERFANIAAACGHEAERYEVPWGESHDPLKVEEILRSRDFVGVLVVHSETSTGVRNPIREISDVAHSRGAKCLIDSVSGVAGLELRFDEWSLDFVLTGSQKALAVPPGLAFAVASEEFLAEAAEAPARGVYFDLIELDSFARRSQTPSTPAVSLFYALDVQLKSIMSEGIESRWARHDAMADLTARSMFRNIAAENVRSHTVSALRIPDGWDAGSFLATVSAKGMTLGAGYGKLKDSTFRLGHMGDHTVEAVGKCLAVCEEVAKSKRQ